MNIAVIGTGYVGLVTGTMLSELGHIVSCLDTNEDKIKLLQAGISPIYEPGLDTLLQNNIKNQRLTFTTKPQEAFRNSDVIFIAVGTPQGTNGAADLTYLEQAARDIATNIEHSVIVVVKSTVPIGTNDRVEAIIRQYIKSDIEVHVVSNPEFLREGHAINDTMHGDRMVIGAENERAGQVVESLFHSIDVPVLHTDRKSAEMIKYASNAFLAVKISYINQISNLCEATGSNIQAVADGMGMDKRIGRAFLNAGLGYGGSCFPKDTEALAHLAKNHDVAMSIVESAIQANIEQRRLFVTKVLNHFNGYVGGKRIAILGLAFKPNTDDMREAPSVDIIKTLASAGAEIIAYDPVVKSVESLDTFNIEYGNSLEECLTNADCALIITEWKEFIDADWKKLQLLMRIDKIFDGRHILESAE